MMSILVVLLKHFLLQSFVFGKSKLLLYKTEKQYFIVFMHPKAVYLNTKDEKNRTIEEVCMNNKEKIYIAKSI